MATKFQVWVDTPTDANTLSYLDLASDAQKGTGFVAGTAASSTRVNSMLRQNSLVVAAFMDVVNTASTLNLRSSMTDVKTELLAYFGLFVVNAEWMDATNTIHFTLKNGDDIAVDVSSIFDKTMAKATADASGNTITSTYATKTELTTAIQTAIHDVLGTGV